MEVKIKRFLKVHSGFKEVRSGLKAALVGLIGCRAVLNAFVTAAGGRAGGRGLDFYWFLGLWVEVGGGRKLKAEPSQPEAPRELADSFWSRDNFGPVPVSGPASVRVRPGPGGGGW